MRKQTKQKGISARAFMATFSTGPVDQPVKAEPAVDRGIPVEVWRDGKWITIWSLTGEVVK